VQAHLPKVSVVVPTYNRLGRLKHVISALDQQQFCGDDYEVIVVSDGSSDGTEDYLNGLRSERNVRCFFQVNKGPAAARNFGIHKAIGEFIVFVDDDVVAHPRLLAEHMRAHRDAGRDVVVVGPLLSPEDFDMAPWIRWEQEMLMKQYRSLLTGVWQASARQFYTGNASLRRSHILAAGGFDEHFRRAEDVELAYRLANRGLDFVFNMDAVGSHYAERSFRSWLQAANTYGHNDVIFARDRGQKWLMPALESEFRQRHNLIQSLVRICRRRPRVTALAGKAMKLAADAATLVGAAKIEQVAYSGLFNLQYYSGLHDELGDAQFFSINNRARQSGGCGPA
jgi:glycosyltransferase involved in cell wall biosynthesis